jgi:hypothetical protein
MAAGDGRGRPRERGVAGPRNEIQPDHFRGYASNVALYPDLQAYPCAGRLAILAIWGRSDPIFAATGPETFTWS